MTDSPPTDVDRKLNWFKNHRGWSTVIVIAVAVIGVGAVADATTDIIGIFKMFRSSTTEQQEGDSDSNGPRVDVETAKGIMRIYSDRNCTGQSLADVPIIVGVSKTTREVGLANDVMGSIHLRNVEAGVVILLYDNPNGDTDDDWFRLEVKQRMKEYCVADFESSLETEQIKIEYHPHDGLNGTVSFFEFRQAD